MTKLTVKTDTETGFFKHGRQVAKLADQGAPIPAERILSFEDPADVLKLMTAERMALFRSIKDAPGSITEISERLHRDRSAVKRDIDELERAGMVAVADKVLPNHGRMKEVRVTASHIRLQADLS